MSGVISAAWRTEPRPLLTEYLAVRPVHSDSRSRYFAAGSMAALAGATPATSAALAASTTIARITPDLDLSVHIGSLVLETPVMPASGCFGPELGRLIPMDELGASVTKTVFAEARGGNAAHRLTEIPAGMVNSVGIPSSGAAGYLAAQHPAYLALGVPVIISVGGHRHNEYAPLVVELNGAGEAYELNVSCPNLDREGTAIGADPDELARVVADVRRVTTKPLIVKLPSMLSSITDCAQAAEDAGADALCVANSLPALALDPRTGAPLLGNVMGGLSGPSIRPVALRLVWLASRAVEIPVIGCGGIEHPDDALEFFAAGAKAVQIGTASFARPSAAVDIARGLRDQCRIAGIGSVAELVGARAR